MNYTELKQVIQDYTENYESTFVAAIPTFVKQAEQRINRSVLIPEFRKNVTGTMTSGNRYLARPTDFLSTFSLAVIDGDGQYNYVLDKDMNFMREAYPNPATTGLPRYYAEYGGTDGTYPDGAFLLGPTPDDTYSYEMQYYHDPESIVDAETSWLGDNADTALLYGALIEAYTFMKGDADLLAVYQKRYEGALANAGIIDVRSKRNSYRDGDLRVE